MTPRLVSDRFPYLMPRVRFGSLELDIECLIDTGFDGDILLPSRMTSPDQIPVVVSGEWRLADGSTVQTDEYAIFVGFGSVGSVADIATVLGDDPLVGRGLIEWFVVTLQHGQQVMVEAYDDVPTYLIQAQGVSSRVRPKETRQGGSVRCD